MDTDQLRQLIRVARTGNITRAAAELGMSQPALSRSLQRLEAEFGRPLLERRSRSVRVTEAGDLVVARAEQVLEILADTRAEIADDAETGRIRLGAIPTVAPYFLPGFLREFARELPQASLVVQEDTTENLLARCKQGEIDLAVLALPINARHVEVTPLFDEELLLVLPTGHPLAAKRAVRLGDVEPFPFVLLSEAHCLADSVVSFCRQRSFQPLVVERTSQLATVQELVALGHGVSLIPDMARGLDRSASRIYRSIDGPSPRRTIAMAWNPYRFESRLLGVLKERLPAFGLRFASEGTSTDP